MPPLTTECLPLGKTRCPLCGRIVGQLFSTETNPQPRCSECIYLERRARLEPYCPPSEAERD